MKNLENLRDVITNDILDDIKKGKIKEMTDEEFNNEVEDRYWALYSYNEISNQMAELEDPDDWV